MAMERDAATKAKRLKSHDDGNPQVTFQAVSVPIVSGLFSTVKTL